jgi:hypothetical protein
MPRRPEAAPVSMTVSRPSGSFADFQAVAVAKLPV